MRRSEDEEDLLGDEPPTYSVLLRRRQTWSFPAVSEALQAHCDLPLHDAARIAKKRPGILASGIPFEQARAMVKSLRALEVDCFLAPDDELFSEPTRRHLESLEILEDGLRGAIAGGAAFTASVPWLGIAMLAAGHIKSHSPGGDIYQAMRKAKTGMVAPRKQVLAFAPQAKRGESWVLDIYCGYTARTPDDPDENQVLHVDSAQFNFGCLRDDRAPHPAENLMRLTRRLASRAPGAILTPGAADAVRAAEEGTRRIAEYDHIIDFQVDALWQMDLIELERRKKQEQP